MENLDDNEAVNDNGLEKKQKGDRSEHKKDTDKSEKVPTNEKALARKGSLNQEVSGNVNSEEVTNET